MSSNNVYSNNRCDSSKRGIFERNDQKDRPLVLSGSWAPYLLDVLQEEADGHDVARPGVLQLPRNLLWKSNITVTGIL